jgi:hypothetical protein
VRTHKLVSLVFAVPDEAATVICPGDRTKSKNLAPPRAKGVLKSKRCAKPAAAFDVLVDVNRQLLESPLPLPFFVFCLAMRLFVLIRQRMELRWLPYLGLIRQDRSAISMKSVIKHVAIQEKLTI